MPDEELANYMILGGGTIDSDSYYIIDCEVSRSELGKNVVSFEFVSRSMTKLKPSSGASAAAATPRITVVEVQEEGEQLASAADRTRLGREASAGADDDLDADGGPASAPDRTHLGRSSAGAGKRERVERSLGRVGSEASEEHLRPEKQAKTMFDTLKTLKDSLYQAMQKGLWEGTSPLQRDNVKELLDELIAVLLEMKKCKTAAEVSSLASRIARWLINEILSRPAFKSMHVFKEPCSIKRLFEGELAEGIDSSAGADRYCLDMVMLIESLAAVLAGTASMPALEEAAVTNRTLFRKSMLYFSFVVAKVDDNLAKAKEASGEARVNLVKECQHVTGLPEAVQYTIDVVIALFDETVSIVGRVAYMLDQPGEERPKVLKLARDWDPDGVIGLAAMSLEEKADMTGKTYLRFEEFSEAAIKTVGGNILCALFALKRYRWKNEYIGD